MQTKVCVRFAECCEHKRNEELIGVLTAISIVSKRLAGRITALEHRKAENEEGGNADVTRQSTKIR